VKSVVSGEKRSSSQFADVTSSALFEVVALQSADLEVHASDLVAVVPQLVLLNGAGTDIVLVLLLPTLYLFLV